MVTLSRLMGLPDLSAYSKDEWLEAERRSPAILRYRKLLELTTKSFSDELRHERLRAWLMASMATLFERALPSAVCQDWSLSADTLLHKAWCEAQIDGLPCTLIALGKLGAEELNLSSDVDLVVVSSPESAALVSERLREFQQLLGAITPLGFCLRTDFDLRPGGRFGPLVTTINQMQDFYWSQGETWERLAWVRARKVCGNSNLAQETLGLMEKFCFRKYLDYTLLDDLRSLRARIHAHNMQGADQYDLKLGPGGIRDIELFVHSLLILHGGRHPQFRTRSTSEAIAKLHQAKILPEEECIALDSAYWHLRQLENLVQIQDDRQTHVLNLSRGTTPPTITLSVDKIVSSLLGEIGRAPPKLPAAYNKQVDWLSEKGFSRETIDEVWPQLLKATALSRHSERDEKVRQDVLFEFVEALARTGYDQSLGLMSVLEFMQSLRAKASFFSLLLREPRLIRDLARLFSLSPYLGKILSSRPELLDSFILRAEEGFSDQWPEFLEQLAERRILAEIIAASQIFESQNVTDVAGQLSRMADGLCQALLTRLQGEYPKSTLQILAMGKWGGKELGFRSDLDLVFVSPTPPSEVDHRVAKRFISRCTESHRGGRIYSIDLRLRPSGSAGPLMISSDQLKEYLQSAAPAWSRQSYLRARWIDEAHGYSLQDLFIARGLSDEDETELAQIRSKLLIKLSLSESWDLKLSEGGLAHIEFVVQTSILRHKLVSDGTSTSQMIETLSKAHPAWLRAKGRLLALYMKLRLIEQLYQLTSNHAGSVVNRTVQAFGRTAAILRMREGDLHDLISATLEESRDLLNTLDPTRLPR